MTTYVIEYVTHLGEVGSALLNIPPKVAFGDVVLRWVDKNPNRSVRIRDETTSQLYTIRAKRVIPLPPAKVSA